MVHSSKLGSSIPIPFLISSLLRPAQTQRATSVPLHFLSWLPQCITVVQLRVSVHFPVETPRHAGAVARLHRLSANVAAWRALPELLHAEMHRIVKLYQSIVFGNDMVSSKNILVAC